MVKEFTWNSCANLYEWRATQKWKGFSPKSLRIDVTNI